MARLRDRLGGRGELIGLLAIVVAVALLWDTPVVYPLRILVVFFHELSHGIAAVITGGSIHEISVVAEEGGQCETLGGSAFVILSAGYLGSVAFGGALLLVGARTRYDKAALTALGILLLSIVALWVRPAGGFGFLFLAGSGAVLLAVAAFLPAEVSDFLLKLLGLTSCIYAVLDIKSDVLDRRGIVSDATELAAVTRVPAVAWGLLWILIATAAGVLFLRAAVSRERRRT